MYMNEDSYPGTLVYHGIWHEYAKYDDIPQDFRNKITDYFVTHKGQGLVGIGLDGWQRAPTYEDYVAWQARYPCRTKPDTGWSTFYEKVLAPLGMIYKEWCQQEVPPLP